MRRGSKSVRISRSLFVLVTGVLILIRAPKAAADPSVSSDPTILSEATSGIVAYYLRDGYLMRVNQTYTIGGGVSSITVGVWGWFNVQRVGTYRPCEWCELMEYPTEADSSHVPMLSKPSLVIDMIRTAANAVQGKPSRSR